MPNRIVTASVLFVLIAAPNAVAQEKIRISYSSADATNSVYFIALPRNISAHVLGHQVFLPNLFAGGRLQAVEHQAAREGIDPVPVETWRRARAVPSLVIACAAIAPAVV